MNRFVTTVLVLIVAACAAADMNNPLERKLGWFHYLNGTDLRDACDGPGRFRFVYNADYSQQVRTYDVAVAADGSARMDIRVLEPVDLSGIEITFGSPDPVGPWRGTTRTVRLRSEDVDLLRIAVRHDAPAPEGLDLPSENTYWISGACIDGAYRFNAFLWPSPRFDSLAFDNLLFAWDPDGAGVRPPARPKSDLQAKLDGEDPEARFRLRVGHNGLWGLGPGF